MGKTDNQQRMTCDIRYIWDLNDFPDTNAILFIAMYLRVSLIRLLLFNE